MEGKFHDVSTEELEEELAKRSRYLIFLRVTPDPINNSELIGWRFKGDANFCSGLCRTLEHNIQDRKNKR